MPRRVVRVAREIQGADDGTLRQGLDAIHDELGVTVAFPPDVQAEAAAAGRAPRLPELDRTDIPLVTIDPPTSAIA